MLHALSSVGVSKNIPTESLSGVVTAGSYWMPAQIDSPADYLRKEKEREHSFPPTETQTIIL